MTHPQISVVIPTYNWPEALKLVLLAFEDQTSRDFEIIVVDDGSRPETAEVIQEVRKSVTYDLTHCWQPDDGFRLARARNMGVAAARGEYIVFIDGDSFPLPNFIANQLRLRERGWLIAGNRVSLSEGYSRNLLHNREPVWNAGLWYWFQQWRGGHLNKFFSLLSLPFSPFRKIAPRKWKRVVGGNMSAWKDDLYAVNGCDAGFQGWGLEDSDMVIRLMNLGVRRKAGRFALTVMHLWHRSDHRQHSAENMARLSELLSSGRTQASSGLQEHDASSDRVWRS